MEIDIFPILHQKEGLARNFDRGARRDSMLSSSLIARNGTT